MPKKKFHYYQKASTLIFFLTLLFDGCRMSQEERELDIQKYVAHLQLDSSTLVVTEVLGDLEVPWEIAYGSDGWIWFTEQKGTVSRLNPVTGEKKVLLQLPDVHYIKSRGLLGMAVHPDVKNYPYIYLHYTFSFENKDKTENIQSRLVRYTFDQDTLTEPMMFLDSIPGKTFHNGSRIVISPDNKLFFSMGDIGETSVAQNINYLTGKILRFNLDGSIPEDNPFPGNPVWAWGFRNPQGLVYSSSGKLYASDHGPANDDEVNLIKKGKNYGWPTVAGFCDEEQEKIVCNDSIITEPLITWSPTIAGSGLAYFGNEKIPEWKNSLLLISLKGRSLRLLKLSAKGDSVIQEKIYFQKVFGRMRGITVSPDGDIFITTSNLDWHPRLQPFMYDSLPPGGDRILRIQKANKNMISQLEKIQNPKVLKEDLQPLELFAENYDYKPTGGHLEAGQKLYMENCAACHRTDGQGVEDLTPPLLGTDWVTGDKGRLIQVLLKGLSDPIEVNGVKYEQEMPSFAHLTDEQIAKILSYVRQSFGNNAGGVLAGEVYEERKGI